jgi:hypothetical protein
MPKLFFIQGVPTFLHDAPSIVSPEWHLKIISKTSFLKILLRLKIKPILRALCSFSNLSYAVVRSRKRAQYLSPGKNFQCRYDSLIKRWIDGGAIGWEKYNFNLTSRGNTRRIMAIAVVHNNCNWFLCIFPDRRQKHVVSTVSINISIETSVFWFA